ncbi:MAG TPA: hypothetical protein VHL98_13440 [Microvirga sp.]|jgi:hypothetical protein|nr:hypothetical protein [Microvirga sp.]
MRTIRPFTLHIQPETDSRPMRVSICLSEPAEGRSELPVTRDCMTLEDLEGCINALQRELDLLRPRAQRAFDCAMDHA